MGLVPDVESRLVQQPNENMPDLVNTLRWYGVDVPWLRGTPKYSTIPHAIYGSCMFVNAPSSGFLEVPN